LPPKWVDITAAAKKAAAEANTALAVRCRERGIPEDFQPRLSLGWRDRGENVFGERRAELRKVAQTQVAALVKEAKLAIDREAAEQLTQLASMGIISQEARAFLGNMPRAEELLPPIDALKLPGDKLVPLVKLHTVTADRNAVVTIARNGVTGEAPDRNTCPTCEKALAPGRGRYCSNACRQAAYRQRQRPAIALELRGGQAT
jgi:predicted nucleic acid-binding Zn ribbon protein